MRIVYILLFMLIIIPNVVAQNSACDVSQLAYVTGNKLGTAQIRIIDSNLKNDRILFDAKAKIRSMDWSPDGTQLVFASVAEPIQHSITIIDTNRSNQIEVVKAPSISQVAWSPDGQWIAYTSTQKLYIIKPDGTNLKEISVATTADDFAWSPDSQYFAVAARDQDKNMAIHVVNLADMTSKQISDPNLSYANDPNWIANDLVTFSSFDGIHVVDPFADEAQSSLYQAIEGGTVTFWENTQVGDAIILHDGDVWHLHDNELTNITN